MSISRSSLAFTLIVLSANFFSLARGAELRERINFDSDWRFLRGDSPDAGDSLGYLKMKPWLLATGTDLINVGVARPTRPSGDPGSSISFVQPSFDDSTWRSLNLPHDWAIEGPFSQDLPGETGKLPWQGVGWYRKHFRLDPTDTNRRIALDIDGAMAFSNVWLNGHYIGGWPYGYTSFQLDLTPYVKLDGDNVLTVRLENLHDSSRWYPGSGIYRNVWLVKTPPVRISHWGVFVSTPRITPESATINIDVYLENTTSAKASLAASTQIFEIDSAGQPGLQPVASSEHRDIEIDPAKDLDGMRSLSLEIPHPKLWDLAHTQRYLAVTTIDEKGKPVDVVKTPFGVRSIVIDPDRGLLLNGQHVLLQGVCLHHDQGSLGTAVNVRALERQIEILQKMGCNAIRTSHNPPAPELLELCDRMGMLVMDEAFDCWRLSKKDADKTAAEPFYRANDYARVFDDWHERDLRALIRRDRNHPSVVMWSIGNEVIEHWHADGWKMAAHLAGIVREEDRTRPITSAFNGEQAGYTGFQTALDIMGYNYKPNAYGPFRHANPAIAVMGSETASTLSTRGEYFFPLTANKLDGWINFQVSSYDLSASEWANTPDDEFRGLDRAPSALGEFVWTGFDYIGEPTPYNSDSTNLLNFTKPEDKERAAAELARLGRLQVPSRSSYFGIVDLAGFPKDRFYLYQARWRPDLPMAHILPHWNWPERAGQITPVHVYSSGDEAELFLNGKSLGRKHRGPLEYRFRWDDVNYAPGELSVVTYKNGHEWARAKTRTTGSATKLLLEADRPQLNANGQDLAYVTVKIADNTGDVVPRTHNSVNFELTGPGKIVGIDNGDPTSLESFQAHTRKAFNGLALVIIKTETGKPGTLTLRTTSEGLASAEINLQTHL
ncbi:MAG TPA: beta-galactosidase GalB [Opitutaceae bacterium]|nr:beta-galactosidase GalB [Opitutaceae bacterium]